jgi:hypothetical protein
MLFTIAGRYFIRWLWYRLLFDTRAPNEDSNLHLQLLATGSFSRALPWFQQGTDAWFCLMLRTLQLTLCCATQCCLQEALQLLPWCLFCSLHVVWLMQ